MLVHAAGGPFPDPGPCRSGAAGGLETGTRTGPRLPRPPGQSEAPPGRRAPTAGWFDTRPRAHYYSASRPGPAVLWTVGERAALVPLA
jgi:hypothetical protein